MSDELQGTLTEHSLESHQTADVAVKIQIQVLAGVAHGDDLINLGVELKPCGRKVIIRQYLI